MTTPDRTRAWWPHKSYAFHGQGCFSVLPRVVVLGFIGIACSSDPAPHAQTNQIGGETSSGTTGGATAGGIGTNSGSGGASAGATSAAATTGGMAASGMASVTTAMGSNTTGATSVDATSTGAASTGTSTSTSNNGTTGAGGGTTTSTSNTTGAGGGSGVGDDVAVYDPQNPPGMLDISGSLGVHDPVVIEQDGTYYMFFTGGQSGINTKTSTDLRSWQGGPTILSPNPSWISGMVSNVRNLWAPDISYFGGVYHLYYSASTFGQNRSCIGHATRPSLADNSQWQDHGMVICSNVEASGDDWNAIDPNIIVDDAGTPWLSFGSFWGGLKIIQLDQSGERADDQVHAIAARPESSGAVEAPFIVKRGSYYYLFMSFDSCCQGTSSTYNIRVARSESVTGPYVDQADTPAMQGGGTLLVQGNNSFHGPGHNAVLFVGNEAYNIYHAYPNNGGQLRIAELAWDDMGWPISGGP